MAWEGPMGRRDELMARYAEDLRTKCGVEPDMALLEKVVKGCGPSIYRRDASTVAATQPEELERIKSSFLMRKLGLEDGPALMEGLHKAVETYGRGERAKQRPVLYYLLVKQFGREAAYG
jgi:hypothetical protein